MHIFNRTDKTPLSQIKKPSQEGQTPTQQQLLLKTLPLTPQNSLADPVSLLDLDFLDEPSSSSSFPPEKYSVVKASSSSLSNLNTQNTNADNPATKSTSQAKSSRLKSSSNEEETLLLVLGSEKSSLVDNNNRNTNNNDNTTAAEEIIEESSSTKTTVSTSAVNGLESGGESSKFCLKNVKELDLENIDLLDDIKPVELNLNEGNSKDVSLTLTFGKYPTFPTFVSVVVVTLTNKSRSTGLLNYVFQLMPPKGLQVYLNYLKGTIAVM